MPRECVMETALPSLSTTLMCVVSLLGCPALILGTCTFSPARIDSYRACTTSLSRKRPRGISTKAGSPRNLSLSTVAYFCTSARSEEHTSELQSLMRISYAVFCLKKQKTKHKDRPHSKTGRTTEQTDTTKQ